MLWYLIAVDALVFGPVGAWMAAQKGRSGGEGFIVGAALGILGIIALGLVPSSTAGMATCPLCAEKVQAAAIVCRHCRAELTPSPVVKPHLSKFAIVLVIAVFGGLVLLAYMQQQTDTVLNAIPTFGR